MYLKGKQKIKINTHKPAAKNKAQNKRIVQEETTGMFGSQKKISTTQTLTTKTCIIETSDESFVQGEFGDLLLYGVPPNGSNMTGVYEMVW